MSGVNVYVYDIKSLWKLCVINLELNDSEFFRRL